MKVLFTYRSRSGALFVLPLDVDGNRSFRKVTDEAMEIAASLAGELCELRTFEVPREDWFAPGPVAAMVFRDVRDQL